MDNTNKIEEILNNEKEWRKYMMEEIKDIKNNQIDMRIAVSNIKTKVAFFAIGFGVIGSFVTEYLKSKIT